jgi:nitroimidazol reductase NimA-like FMN-containing flavoprotein (pyridoxamine 5'-phosphate oxidase superfamily)
MAAIGDASESAAAEQRQSRTEGRSGPPAQISAGVRRPALIASAVKRLSEGQCLALLARAHIGRLALITPEEWPAIFPMDFVLHDGRLFLRSGPGQKLYHLARNNRVCFETEGDDGGFRWSVVVRGVARRLDRDDEIEASGVLSLVSTSPTSKYDFIEITPVAVTGRSFRPQR